ncbi:MAG: efflux RND transporter permease subunit [Deltaproteobacteria bacterium]|nr:efflux RND transporter permease subunit [Deltaproteobacteria bacterium]
MKLADVSIRRPVLASVMVGALLVFGLVAYPRIGVDLFPDVEFPVVTITAVYPGADPETIESKVIDKLEEAVSTINGIKVLRSTSLENVGQVVVQFELERKADQAVQDVRDKVATAVRNLPRDLEPPVVAKFDVGAAPILALALSGPRSIRDLTELADTQIKQRLQSIQGVGGVDLVGSRQREFHVWIDPQRLEARGLSVQDVIQGLASQNVEIPGGRLNVGQQELMVKTRGQVHTARELGQITITSFGGSAIRVADVGRVEDGEEEPRSYSSLDGQAAVSLIVRKQSGANTVQVADAVRKALAKIQPTLPQGVKVTVPLDNSTYIRHAISEVQFDLGFGALLAVVIILLFLHDWRATFISALAIPTSVIATFAFIRVMGFTFNNMTMLALSLSIGILVDDAIVVIEAIHRHVSMGKSPFQAASDACREIGLAVMATTASVVAVFVPVAVMQGMIGRFFLQFGLTVAFAVSVSLFVAFTITPMLSARMLRTHEGKGPIASRIEVVLALLDRAYRRILQAALRHRAITLIVATVVFFGSCGLMKFVPFEFMPPEDRGDFMVRVELPTGTDLSTTSAYVEGLSKKLRGLPGVTATFATVAGAVGIDVNKAEIQVNLVPRAKRAFSQDDAMAHVRGLLGAQKDGVVFTVDRISPMSGGGFRAQVVQFNIRGKDFKELNEAASTLTAELRKRSGYVDLDSTYRGGKPEISVTIDRDRAADLGVPIVSLAATLNALIAGQKATELATEGDRYDVRVRLEDSFRRAPETLLGLKVRSVTGQLVSLSSLVTIGRGTGPALIERQGRQRQVTVLANLQGKALGDAVQEIETTAKEKFPSTLTSDWTGMGDVMKESVGHMLTALILAILMVYLILAAQFESFVHPFTIMLSLPLSLVGALGALAVARMSMNIFSMIGIIMLMGLVTKNAILLVDYANHLRQQGMDRFDALLQAGPIRLRPILMTTAAMIAGMIPVALGKSQGGEQRAPMAVCVIGGLITSTLLTLVVVPVVYSLIEGAAERLRRRGKGSAVEETAAVHEEPAH